MNYKTKLVLATATLSGALLLSQVDAKADTYTLQSGDSFYSVAQMYGLSVYDLAALNGMSIYDTIVPGQVLQIPIEYGSHLYPCPWDIPIRAPYSSRRRRFPD